MGRWARENPGIASEPPKMYEDVTDSPTVSEINDAGGATPGDPRDPEVPRGIRPRVEGTSEDEKAEEAVASDTE
jgi:hypothetical protein